MRKVKIFLESSQGNLELALFNFSCISDIVFNENDFAEAIVFVKARIIRAITRFF